MADWNPFYSEFTRCAFCELGPGGQVRNHCRRARAVELFSAGRRLVSFRILYVNWKLYVNPVKSWLRFLSEPVGQSNHLA